MSVDVDASDLGELLDIVKAMVLGEFIIIGPALAVFVGILGSFVITRGITRTIRSKAGRGTSAGPIKDITVGGVHIHHQVFGIVTMFIAGLLIIATDAQDSVLNTLALLFGVGVGLAFDEFALWLHLDDVYWSRQGRKSIDAVAWTLVATASVRAVLDLSTVFEGTTEAGSMWWLPVLLFMLTVVPAGICAAKGKLVTAALGIVYQPIGLIGAFRLGKPGSLWDRAIYGPTSRRRRRAERRFGANYQGRWERLRDLVGGGRRIRGPGRRAMEPVENGTAGEDPPVVDVDDIGGVAGTARTSHRRGTGRSGKLCVGT